jgi:hypothetical protein
MNEISITQDFKCQFSRDIGKSVFKSKTLVKSTGMFRIRGIIFNWISIQGKCVEKMLIPSTGMCVGGK